MAVRKERRTSSAEGDETFLGEDRGDLRRFTHAAIDAGADCCWAQGHTWFGDGNLQREADRLLAGELRNLRPFNLSAENGLTMVLEAHLASDGTFLRGKLMR